MSRSVNSVRSKFGLGGTPPSRNQKLDMYNSTEKFIKVYGYEEDNISFKGIGRYENYYNSAKQDNSYN